MTPDERQLLEGLFDRIRGAANNPRDRDAEALIADAVRTQPYAPYLLTQTVIVQEQTLGAAAKRIEELEAQVKQLQSETTQGSFLGNVGKSIFGSAPAPQAPTPSPWSRAGAAPQGLPGGAGYAAPPQQQPAPWQQPQAAAGGGASFLKGALGAAAGVAGGVMLANSLSGLFGGHHGNNSLGIGSGLDSARGNDSPLDRHDAPQQANYGAHDSSSSGQSIDDGLPGAEQASYDDSNSGYSDDSSDV